MKAFASTALRSMFRSDLASSYESAPQTSTDTSTPMRPLEIRRYVRNMRKNRQYNFTPDFIY